MNDLTDFLGRTIAAGDILVFPVRRGSKMRLNRIVVTKVVSDIHTIHGTSPRGRMVTIVIEATTDSTYDLAYPNRPDEVGPPIPI